jgi:glycosyltransferase involved in cell wall biosynthesis
MQRCSCQAVHLCREWTNTNIVRLLSGITNYTRPYRYPPLTALLVAPLTLLGPCGAATVWLAVNALAMVGGCGAWQVARSDYLCGAALALGTPVIAGNTSSLPEVAGEAALLVDPTSVEELTRTMCCLLENEHLRDEMRAKGPTRAVRFSWEHTARETLAAYGSIL